MARKDKFKVTEKMGKSPIEEAPVKPSPVQENATPANDNGPKKVIVTPEELARLQRENRLIGYDPITCEAPIQ